MGAVVRATACILPNGRLHLQDGPIDLIVFAEGDVDTAYRAATTHFATVLDALCEELHLLRASHAPQPRGEIARTMRAAVEPLARYGFITPMAAVAGAVAEAILAAMTHAAPLTRAAVNNGGDIALHLAPGQQMRIGMVAKPELGTTELFGRLVIDHKDAARGLATSGCHGRSFSLGIADAVTVLAHTAAEADAAATVIANAVDLPNHPGIIRRAARDIQPDSDLGDRLVTRDVPPLSPDEIETALARGRRRAEDLLQDRLIVSAALHLQGVTAIIEREHVHA
jgi:ApbE superfamily uncharacterized protein (UPF0280 family)